MTLDEMTKKLEQKKERAAELRGEKASQIKRLTEEGCKTIEEAEKEIEKEESKAGKLQKEFDKKLEQLEIEYEW